MIGLESSPRTWEAGSARRSTRLAGAFLPLRVVLFGLAAPLFLRRPPERLAAWLESAAPSQGAPPMAPMTRETLRTAAVLVRRIDFWMRAAWPLVRRGCLPRGITRFWFLRRAGIPVSLRFGIGEIAGRLEGHCWLVLGGEPFAEPRDPRLIYTETWRIPREGRA
jgi:hypothetical protein